MIEFHEWKKRQPSSRDPLGVPSWIKECMKSRFRKKSLKHVQDLIPLCSKRFEEVLMDQSGLVQERVFLFWVYFDLISSDHAVKGYA